MTSTLLSSAVALTLAAAILWLINTRIRVPGSMQPILNVVLMLVAVGTGLWLINTYIPMASSIKAILNIVVVVAACIGVLKAVGLWGEVSKLWTDIRNHRIPH